MYARHWRAHVRKNMLLTSIISLILFSGSPEVQSTPDGRHYREARLVFRWDRSNYEDNYLGNTEAADKLFNMLEEIGQENIDSVNVVAYASPEGVYEHNLKLSRNRAKEFNSAVKQRLGLQEKNFPIKVTAGGEAWEQLRYRVASDSTMSEAARSRTLSLLDDDSIPRDTKKWRMMHNALGATREEGDIYHWLLLNHYRYLRCLAIKIYVNDGADAGASVTPGDSTTTVAPADTTVITDSTVVPDSDRGSVPPSDGGEEKVQQPEPEENQFQEGGQEQDGGQAQDGGQGRSRTKRTGTPILGISTNLIYDATWIPNYGFTSVPSFSLEYYPARGHWTYGADVDWSHWLHYPEHRFNQIHNITLHARRYFKTGEEGFKGLYLKGSLNAFEYGLGWDQHGWEGEGLGIGAGIGHKWNWGCFFLDTGIDAGLLYSRFDPYVWGNDATGWYYYDYAGDPNEFVTRRKGFTWFGPVRAYISIGFDLFKRKK